MAARPAPSVAQTLHQAGLSVCLSQEGGLEVRPASILTLGLRDLIRNNKTALVDWLMEAANDEDNWRVTMPPDTLPLAVAKFRAASRMLDASQVYYDHHFSCPPCIAAGHGYGARCGFGGGLWRAFSG